MSQIGPSVSQCREQPEQCEIQTVVRIAMDQSVQSVLLIVSLGVILLSAVIALRVSQKVIQRSMRNQRK
eukprot:60122-Amphidinium_carterae.1